MTIKELLGALFIMAGLAILAVGFVYFARAIMFAFASLMHGEVGGDSE